MTAESAESSGGDRIRNLITLQGDAALMTRIPSELRVEIDKEFTRYTRKRSAAELLTSASLFEEAWPIARDAYKAARATADRIAETGLLPMPKSLSTLAEAADRTIAEVEGSQRAVDRRTIHAMLTPTEAIDPLCRKFTTTSFDVQLRRFMRVGVLLAFAAVLAFQFIPRMSAAASASYNDNFVPRYVLDGDRKTSWFLPDRAEGWIDILASRPINLHRVMIANGVNGPLDRGAKDIEIVAFRNQTIINSAKGTMPTPVANPKFSEVALEAQDIDRVRINVKSFYGSGGGFSDIKLE